MKHWRVLAALATGCVAPIATAQQPPPPPIALQPAMRMKLIAPVAQTPAKQATTADVIILGKITEIEKDTVEATAFPGAPKDQKVAYKIAILKNDESLLGGKGLTQFRVGFLADAVSPPANVPGLPGGGRVARPVRVGAPTIALTADMEGCFYLTRHHEGDFYVISGFGGPLLKTNEKYASELEEVRKIVKAIDDPVSALKAKDLNDRFAAAQTILQRYQTPHGTSTAREPIPAEENKLLVALLAELPWTPEAGKAPDSPSRSALWYSINAQESGFAAPTPPAQRPGDAPVDYNKLMDEASAKFLKENADAIKIKRYVVK